MGKTKSNELWEYIPTHHVLALDRTNPWEIGWQVTDFLSESKLPLESMNRLASHVPILVTYIARSVSTS